MQNLSPMSSSAIIMRTTFPKESRDHETRINEIADIIFIAASDKIAFIILFGPFASGDFVINSDYNFLILTKEKSYANKNKVNRLKKIITNKVNSAFEDKAPCFHLTIEPVDYANCLVNPKKYFFADIKKEGILIYDSGKYELLRFSGLEINLKSRIKDANINYYYWLNKANEFMRHFQFGIEHGYLNIAAFNLHQAAENLFNCTIAVFNGYEPRTHDLVELNKLCSANSTQFINVFPNNNAESRKSFNLLRKAYPQARYDKKYKISKKQLEYLADRVRILMEIVIRNCAQRIN